MSGNPGSTLAEGPHRYGVRVYFEDTDAGGIVYHANYLRFAERARTEALRALGVPHAELMRDHHLIFVVRRVELDYLRPARLDDALEVVTEPASVSAASVVMRQDIRGTQGSCALAQVTLACVRAATGRPARIPSRWRTALDAMARQTNPAAMPPSLQE